MALPKLFSYEQVEDAIKESGGYLTTAADLLNCKVDTVRKYLRESKQLREILFETRERYLDVAETELIKMMKQDTDNKAKITALIFYLKSQGKERGWIDRADWVKPGVSSDKPLYIKIMPITGIGGEVSTEKRKPGRPVKNYIDVKVNPEKKPKMITGLVEEVIDVDVPEEMIRNEAV